MTTSDNGQRPHTDLTTTNNGRAGTDLVELVVQRAAVLHVLHEVSALALVRRDDADLLGLDAALQEARHDLLNVARLGPARQRLTRAHPKQTHSRVLSFIITRGSLNMRKTNLFK